ncbi:MAG: UbiA prenyltransferase family protein [bacterium]|nr:UbiA prenyltransferase family protein [bacterium]
MTRARRWGPRLLGPAFDYLLFLRPRQWPILTAQLSVGVLAAPAVHDALVTRLAPPGPSAADPSRPAVLLLAWLAWVLCLNGGTLAFNSAHDRDEEDIAYLRAPPAPPPRLAAFSLGLMAAGLIPALLVSPRFAGVTAACILLSVVYSHPATRWKGVPGLDLAVNMVGYGAGTTLAGLLAGQAAAGLPDAWPGGSGLMLAGGFALLFGSFYPMTQLYQIEADRARGDRTLATALGATRSLDLALLLAVGAAALLFGAQGRLRAVPQLILGLSLTMWILAAAAWRMRATRLTPRQHEARMYTALILWASIDAAVLIGLYA